MVIIKCLFVHAYASSGNAGKCFFMTSKNKTGSLSVFQQPALSTLSSITILQQPLFPQVNCLLREEERLIQSIWSLLEKKLASFPANQCYFVEKNIHASFWQAMSMLYRDTMEKTK